MKVEKIIKTMKEGLESDTEKAMQANIDFVSIFKFKNLSTIEISYIYNQLSNNFFTDIEKKYPNIDLVYFELDGNFYFGSNFEKLNKRYDKLIGKTEQNVA